MRSLWAKRQLKRLLDIEGDVLDLIAVHDAAVELDLTSPINELRDSRAKAIRKRLRADEPPARKKPRREDPGKPVPSRRPLSGFIYVIRSAAGKHKIGSARDPMRRLRDFQTAHAEPLEIVLEKATTNRAGLERICQRRFADKRVGGEWFDLDADDLRWLRDLPAM